MSRSLAFYDSSAAATGAELYATDGTAAGTFLVQDIYPGPGNGDPNGITALAAGGIIFAAADGPAAGKQLFVSDGTANGTVELSGGFILVARPQLGISQAINSSLADFTPFGPGALFAGATSQAGVQLWYTDGTFAGTAPVQSFGPNAAVVLNGITSLGSGRAVFDLGNGATQPGLWGTDGTAGGTVLLSSQAAAATAIGNGLALTVLDSGFGNFSTRAGTLGVTDGTQAGTRTLQTFTASYAYPPVSSVTPIGNGRALFSVTSGNGSVWESDGTAAGTFALLQDPNARETDFNGFDASAFTPLGNGRTVFAASDGTARTAVYATDGTVAGTVLLADTAPAMRNSAISRFVPFGANKALFAVQDGMTGAATIWSTDGTAAGTVAVQAIPAVPNTGGTVYPLGGIAALPNGRAVFDVDAGAAGVQVFSTDGTAAGTSVVATLPAKANIPPSGFTVLPNGKAIFSITLPTGYGASYATDGTAAGTGQFSTMGPYGGAVVATAADANAGAPPASPDPRFDTGYYLAHNPDVAASGIDPYQHYLALGGTEGRNPDAFFDSRYYLQQNPDVAAAGVNPLQHYEQYGWHEGRDPSLVFSVSKYLSANPDVAAAGTDPLQHFIQYGTHEGRMAFLSGGTGTYDLLVDTTFYDAQLGATLVPTPAYGGADQAATSYYQVGWQRGLNPDALFDTNYYEANNPDVAAAHVNPLLQYETQGWKEGRNPSAAFSTSKYLLANPDVARAGINPLFHYINNGQREGRAIYSV